ncbi:MAG: hypothetical protein V3U06_04535 [Candidatus Binatia bacterium]
MFRDQRVMHSTNLKTRREPDHDSCHRAGAYEKHLAEIQAQGLRHILTSRMRGRIGWLAEFEENDWEKMIRTSSPHNPAQRKSRRDIKRREKGNKR